MSAEEHTRSSLRHDGSRVDIQPADVSGRFNTARRITFVLLIAMLVCLPLTTIGGHPAVFLDVDRRAFYLFGLVFNAGDIWLVFFLLSGAGFSLVVLTTLAGRVWCGWACPQTVFLEGVYRRIERIIEGPASRRLRMNAGNITFGLAIKKIVKHIAFALASVAIAHIFVAYFVSPAKLMAMVREAPGEHWEAFLWMGSLSLVLYLNFAFFREQFCLIVCPYGRLQSALLDAGSLVVGYDSIRGEPRGKAASAQRGDCVDCGRCVAVCPTAIDIRNGLQLDCIGCTACIDACDDVMVRLGQPRGLIRYDSQQGLAHLPRRFWRPRLALYSALLIAGIGAFSVAVAHRSSFDASLIRIPGQPYSVAGGAIVNGFTVHLSNKSNRNRDFEITARSDSGVEFDLPLKRAHLAPMGMAHLPVIAHIPQDKFMGDTPFVVEIRADSDPNKIELHGRFLGGMHE